MEKTFLSKQGESSFRGKQGKYKRKREIHEKQNFCHLPWTSGSVNTWQREKDSINFFKGGPLPLRCDLSTSTSLLAAWATFGHIYFRHQRPKMTSETSESTIFLRFYFSLCYLMLTWPDGHHNSQDVAWSMSRTFVIMPNATKVVRIYLTLIFRGISQNESAHHL